MVGCNLDTGKAMFPVEVSQCVILCLQICLDYLGLAENPDNLLVIIGYSEGLLLCKFVEVLNLAELTDTLGYLSIRKYT